MRAAAPGRAIVAGLAILAGCALGGCGQRGSLYLADRAAAAGQADRSHAKRAALTTSSRAGHRSRGPDPDTSGTPLSLAPETELATPPASAAIRHVAPLPASAATPAQ